MRAGRVPSPEVSAVGSWIHAKRAASHIAMLQMASTIRTFSSLSFFHAIITSYAQEMPTRFKKEIVLAASTGNEDVKVIGLQKVLSNIGASQAISVDEMRAIFAEMGNADGAIPAKKMVQLL